jgi:histone H3/H4
VFVLREANEFYSKILKDNIQGVTKGDIRRLARRGGVKRISANIYDETRVQLRKFLEDVLKDAGAVTGKFACRRTQAMHIGVPQPLEIAA